jgi:hypothetical protein
MHRTLLNIDAPVDCTDYKFDLEAGATFRYSAFDADGIEIYREFMSDELCDEIVDLAESCGFRENKYKKADQVNMLIGNLVPFLEKKVPAQLTHSGPYKIGFFVDDYNWDMRPRINNCFRITKYPAAGEMGYHRDNQYTKYKDSAISLSQYSLLIYLNDCEGELVFVDDAKCGIDFGATIDEELAQFDTGDIPTLNFSTEKGTCAIFDQAYIHKATHTSAKYVLRTDIYFTGYKRSQTGYGPEYRIYCEVCKLFRNADLLTLEGRGKEAAVLYEVCNNARVMFAHIGRPWYPDSIEEIEARTQECINRLRSRAVIIKESVQIGDMLMFVSRTGGKYIFEHYGQIQNNIKIACIFVLMMDSRALGCPIVFNYDSILSGENSEYMADVGDDHERSFLFNKIKNQYGAQSGKMEFGDNYGWFAPDNGYADLETIQDIDVLRKFVSSAAPCLEPSPRKCTETRTVKINKICVKFTEHRTCSWRMCSQSDDEDRSDKYEFEAYEIDDSFDKNTVLFDVDEEAQEVSVITKSCAVNHAACQGEHVTILEYNKVVLDQFDAQFKFTYAVVGHMLEIEFVPRIVM